jgi:hypothetical protein
MTTFDNREQAFENKFAHDEEMLFKITARRNKLLGLWAAEPMPHQLCRQILRKRAMKMLYANSSAI